MRSILSYLLGAIGFFVVLGMILYFALFSFLPETKVVTLVEDAPLSLSSGTPKADISGALLWAFTEDVKSLTWGPGVSCKWIARSHVQCQTDGSSHSPIPYQFPISPGTSELITYPSGDKAFWTAEGLWIRWSASLDCITEFSSELPYQFMGVDCDS